MPFANMFTKNIQYYNNKLLISCSSLLNEKQYKNNFIFLIVVAVLYSLADKVFFNYTNTRWFHNSKNIIYLYIFLLCLIVASLPITPIYFIKNVLLITICITICFIGSSLFNFEPIRFPVTESISNVVSSDENNFGWAPFEQPDLPTMSLINQIKDKYNKDFTTFRNDFLVTNDECLFYYKHGKFPYNNNLLRPSYNHMLTLDPQNTQSFEEWKDSYYKVAQQTVPMRVLILRAPTGTTGFELQGIKETDFANKLYQGKLSLDNLTIVGCRSNGTPYMKESGTINDTKTDTDIYDAINKVFDIEFLESSRSGCTKDRQLCTDSNILRCPFSFKDENQNTRMSNTMAEFWNMNETQTRPFNTGCFTIESCKEQQNA
tara:strand:+ start:5672 stop:6796 length:1125 start_codon:yes stop_codon:yes gene_type:complete